MLHGLKLTRQLEERIELKLYRQGKILGGVFSSRGQEAISIGAALALQDDDLICPSHRDMGIYLLRGMTPERILGHHLGRINGPSKGKDGNLHTGDIELGLISFVSHLADTIPVAAGVALSYKLRALPRVASVFFGDGGSSRGDFHEALNLAAVWKLPVVFVCNNNQYAYSTPLAKQMAVPGIAERAIGYGFPTHTVDGNDVVEVFRMIRSAAERARTGGGPTLIEAVTFRMSGHAAHDDAPYVPKELFAEWEKKDPIARLEQRMLSEGLLDEQDIRRLESEIDLEIDRALAVAQACPEPEPESALSDVYADEPRDAPLPSWKSSLATQISCNERVPAEVKPVDSEEGESSVTYLEAIRQGLTEELDSDPRVYLMGEDIADYGGAFKVTEGLLERFGPDRVIDTPVAESGIVGAAIGSALAGMRPVVELQFIDFISCAFDQLTNFAAKSRYRWGAAVPLVVRGPCGARVHGGPFHSQNVESYFLHTPGLKIVAPATAEDARGLIKSAIRDDDPVLYFEHKYLYRRIRGTLPRGDGAIPIGKAVCRRRGSDLSIITFGAMVFTALDAAEALAEHGASVEVLDLRTLMPLDHDAVLESVARTGKVIVLHESPLTGGIGGELAAIIAERAFEYLDGPVRRIAATDTPVPYAKPLEEYHLPQVEDIVRVARELLKY
jgi:pyruvate/2-oxoglutarate/acetoin dehydrogenase E1 component/TPP-dependent pyruvate/acetoin dehydrogenase alpha subunit